MGTVFILKFDVLFIVYFCIHFDFLNYIKVLFILVTEFLASPPLKFEPEEIPQRPHFSHGLANNRGAKDLGAIGRAPLSPRQNFVPPQQRCSLGGPWPRLTCCLPAFFLPQTWFPYSLR